MKNPTIDDIGRDATDVITGFKGRITAYCSYITGCDQFLLAPGVDKENKHVAAKWFDQNRLKLGKSKRLVLETAAAAKKGACEPAPIK